MVNACDRTTLDLPVQGKVKGVTQEDLPVKIGELAAATGTTTTTLRFYDAGGLLPPAGRTANGYRDYGPDALDRLDFIRRGRAAGLTLAQVKDVIDIRSGGQAPCTHVTDLLATRVSKLDCQIADLTALRSTVARLHQAAQACEPSTCQPHSICRYL